MDPAEPAYLTIVRLPQEPDLPRVVALLAESAGIDPFHSRLRLARKPPVVVQRIDAGIAAKAVSALRQAGILAIAPTRQDLRAIAPVIQAKRLAPALGAPEPMFMCEPWRAEPFGFRGKDIVLMVRGRLQLTKRSAPRLEQTGMSYEPITGTVAPTYESVRDSHSSLSDLLDVYLRDRRRLRCNGDKFNFDALGTERGWTDNENMDKLSIILAESAPRAIVDLGFADFHCPPGMLGSYRSTPAGGSVRDDHPLFDFYSPWILQVYRALAAGERSPG